MSDVAATHEGVEESQPVISERDRLIAEIAQRRETTVAEENEREAQPVLTEKPKETDEQDDDDQGDQSGDEADGAVINGVEVLAAETAPKVEEAPRMVKIRVDGVDMEVPFSKVEEAGIRALQKESTADKRLEESTRLLRETQEMVAGKKDAPPTDEDLLHYAQNGTPEQQFVARNEITRRQQATADGFVQEATRRAVEAVRVEDGAKWFMDEYKDILKDPLIAKLVAEQATDMENRMRKGEITLSHREAYQKIGDDMRAWVKGLRGDESKDKTTDTKTFDAKREQKSNITTLKTASTRKVAPNDQEPESTSTIIEKMRRARGQH
jgi:hypothetical protein